MQGEVQPKLINYYGSVQDFARKQDRNAFMSKIAKLDCIHNLIWLFFLSVFVTLMQHSFAKINFYKK